MAGDTGAPDAAVVEAGEIEPQGGHSCQSQKHRRRRQSRKDLGPPQMPPGPGRADKTLRSVHSLVAQKVQRPQHGGNGRLSQDGAHQRPEEELVAPLGDGPGVQVHSGTCLGQMVHPGRQGVVFPGHPRRYCGGRLYYLRIELLQNAGVVGCKGILQAGDGLEQDASVLRLRQGGQPIQERLIHPLAQEGCVRRGLIEKGPVPL